MPVCRMYLAISWTLVGVFSVAIWRCLELIVQFEMQRLRLSAQLYDELHQASNATTAAAAAAAGGGGGGGVSAVTVVVTPAAVSAGVATSIAVGAVSNAGTTTTALASDEL